MKFPNSKIISESDLNTLVEDVKNKIENGKVVFHYPEKFRRKIKLSTWETNYKEIVSLNKALLDEIHNRAGVYAVYVKEPAGDIQLMYVGQTNAGGARQRIKSHLVWRNKDTESGKSTGSKFDEVFVKVTSGFDIYISFCQVEPASLRHYVEENMFMLASDGWNIHGT